MYFWLSRFRNSLAVKVLLLIALVLILCLGLHSWGTMHFLTKYTASKLSVEADRLSKTILLSARYAMMANARNEIDQIVSDIAKHPDITSVRIYDKQGVIRFSNIRGEVGTQVSKETPSCSACHSTEPPKTGLTLDQRTRTFAVDDTELLGTITPIMNDKSCSVAPCHAHNSSHTVLGELELVLQTDQEFVGLSEVQNKLLALTGLIYILSVSLLVIGLRRYITTPIKKIINSTKRISEGKPSGLEDMPRTGELGNLVDSVVAMEQAVAKKQAELDKNRREYQDLFEQVPCSITVQDADMRILKYNKEFAERFNPKPGAYCYEAYKGLSDKCPNCPLDKTFETGSPYCSEESRTNPDGTKAHWLVHVAPVFDENGEVVAAMEMGIDISARKRAEERLISSEAKYHAIFNHIPNAVFVLDVEDYNIIDCNDMAERSYGYDTEEMHDTSFIHLFPKEEQDKARSYFRAFTALNRVRQKRKDGSTFYVDFRLSPAVYNDRNVLLVTAMDVTDRLEAEQKLIQAGKMATLGEMATGVAHELNQPLTVIKTASGFIMRKINRSQPIDSEILKTMAEEIDSHVDRASQIIDHMRAFGRQSDHALERVNMNSVIKSSVDMFISQLTLRGISVEMNFKEKLPEILGVANRLEQVFINLLLNARDAIEEASAEGKTEKKVITLRTYSTPRAVVAVVEDTGAGVPAGLIDKIFEPFFTTKKVGKGTGLGLSISYGLIKDFGGTIRVKNKKEGGAQFTLMFPRSSSRR
ncbi:PAS domain-containing sensor histidine kinase [Halodesulfovibrio marinisediminis]|uniref:histidine kinase n=1 Tax=Halodesulfovibrio marinisediminis DSM 17456 TaxID=1121457 RepID=A0A1N6J911_9BACT|nr:PAS domain-containing sensor histidine kinase [Halodesulfovibrio marinisediminis]SIO40767.1 histidine kinase [Halodesulfovibrio marinisediminis DSM 17456]